MRLRWRRKWGRKKRGTDDEGEEGPSQKKARRTKSGTGGKVPRLRFRVV